jgi:hypothetical protein
MKNNRIRTISAALSCAFILAACTANDGVATTETTVFDPYATTQTTVDLSGESVETIYGNQLPNYLNHQYYFEGQPVPMTESNFYFIDTFSELTQYAGYYYPATSEGFIDLSATIDSTGLSGEISQYTTFGDFFVAYSEEMIESACIINKLAADEGLTLPDETMAQIDSMMEELNSSAAAANLSTDEYLSIYYGEGANLEDFRTTVIDYYLADYYTQNFIENYELDPEEITVPNVRYTLFMVDPTTATDEDKAAAEAAATAMFEEAAGDVDAFTVSAALAYTNGEVADYGEIGVPDDGSIDEVFTQWAWDESRQEGDLDMIYSENFGYFIVAYIGTTEIDQSAQDQLIVKKMSEMISDAINNNEYEFYTNDAYAAAPTPVPAETLATDILGQPLPTETEPVSSVGSLTGNKGLDILLISLSVIGAVAVLGLAALGVMHLSKGKGAKSDEKVEKESKEEDTDADN